MARRNETGRPEQRRSDAGSEAHGGYGQPRGAGGRSKGQIESFLNASIFYKAGQDEQVCSN
jgi:hypothetical protein